MNNREEDLYEIKEYINENAKNLRDYVLAYLSNVYHSIYYKDENPYEYYTKIIKAATKIECWQKLMWPNKDAERFINIDVPEAWYNLNFDVNETYTVNHDKFLIVFHQTKERMVNAAELKRLIQQTKEFIEYAVILMPTEFRKTILLDDVKHDQRLLRYYETFDKELMYAAIKNYGYGYIYEDYKIIKNTQYDIDDSFLLLGGN